MQFRRTAIDNTKILLRSFTPSDAEAIADIFHRSVREAALADYSPAQVAAWSPVRPDPSRFVKQAEGRIFLIAESTDGEPIAYGDLEPDGHIDHLYCDPRFVGKGVASALYDGLEAAALAAGLSKLFVEASEAARRLFERKGFSVDSRHDFELNGAPIHNYSMSKRLSAPG